MRFICHHAYTPTLDPPTLASALLPPWPRSSRAHSRTKRSAQALERNLILRADTGSGKTLVAVMLMRAISSREADEGSLVVLLTPTVTLMHQQASVLRSQTFLRVKEFVGADGVEFWKRETWQEHLRHADAIVLTPAIFLDILSKAYWSLD
ncbi:hypothetical protein JCM8547_009119 [Rhodosporidiobolus lusitaniae]